MKQVTKKEFYGIIDAEKLDVHPHPDYITENRDFTDSWEFKDRRIFGKTVSTQIDENGNRFYPPITKYYLNK